MKDDITRKAEALKTKLEREIKDEFLVYLQDCRESIEFEELHLETVEALRASVKLLKKNVDKGHDRS